MMPQHGDGPSVAVAVITYRRPKGLRELLAGLADVELPAGLDAGFCVVVVDNDATGSARSTVEDLRGTSPWPIEYVVEPEQGIPQARNRALAECAAVDFVAFVDDDEVPGKRWLSELLRVQAETGADAVTGPVEAAFETTPPSWVRCAWIFNRPRFAEGAAIEWATTSNVLLARSARRTGQLFNEAMRFTGGSDTHFFMRLKRQGGSIVWADRALVVEHFPASRLTLRWVLARQYRRGNTQSLCYRDLDPRWGRRVRQVVRGLWRVARGLSLLPLALAGRRCAVLHGLQSICLGAGLITGVAGVRYEEYRVVHGR